MTRERDIEQILDHWFADRPTEVPERVIDTVADRIARQPQHAAWRLPWRDAHVNSYLKYAAAVAAVILVAAVGFVVLGRPSDSGVGTQPAASTPSASPAAPGSSPSPAAPASPSSAPSASAVFPAWFTNEADSGGAGILPAGGQTTRSFMPGSTFTVPEGWVNSLDLPIAYALFPDTPANEAEYARSGETAGIFMVSVESPYFYCEAWEEFRGTAAERVAFLAASDAFVVSEPVDVTIGGLTGKQVDLRLDPDRPTATCPGDPPGSDPGDVRNRVTYLDKPDGGVIAIAAGSSHAEAMPIIESFQFDIAP